MRARRRLMDRFVPDPASESESGTRTDGAGMVIENSARIFERTGTSWAQTGTAASVQGPDIEIDNGRIIVSSLPPTVRAR